MNKYRITVRAGGNEVIQFVLHADTMEGALAAAKRWYQGKGYSFVAESEQLAGEFDGGPFVTSVCLLNGSQISVKVHYNGWCALVDNRPTSLSDIPATMHSMIKAMVKSTAYDAGFYTKPPTVESTARWEKIDWINHVQFNFPI